MRKYGLMECIMEFAISPEYNLMPAWTAYMFASPVNDLGGVHFNIIVGMN